MLDQVTNERDEAWSKFDELRKQRLDRFMFALHHVMMQSSTSRNVSIVAHYIKVGIDNNSHCYCHLLLLQMITLGGDVEWITLTLSLKALFSAFPLHRELEEHSNLSGGEKTLSSLALLFALHHVMMQSSTSRNVSIVAHYIKVGIDNNSHCYCHLLLLFFFVVVVRNELRMHSLLLSAYGITSLNWRTVWWASIRLIMQLTLLLLIHTS